MEAQRHKGLMYPIDSQVFDHHEGEVMVFDKVILLAHGTVQTMRPAVPLSNR
jgi:hypothetical protein